MLIDSLQKFVNPGHRLRHLAKLGVLAGLAFMVAPVKAQNASVSLDLNDDAVRITGQQIRPARQVSFGGSVFNHQDRGTVLTGDFHIIGNAATKARPITAGLGGRLVYTDVDEDFVPADPIFIGGDVPKQKGYGLAVGGFFNGQIPNYDRFGYGGHLYFSPDVLAFGDLKEYADVWLYGSYSVLRNGDVYVGVRSLKADFKAIGDFNFDTGLHVGFTLKF